MNFFNKLLGKKQIEIQTDKQKQTEYFIDIDPNSSSLSTAFKDFYTNHFIDSYGLAREEVDLDFFTTMTTEEKEIAKRLIRQNLKLRQVHLFKASAYLNDKEALPILYEQFNSNTDFSWLMTIGQSIWKLNKDELYPKLLRQLKKQPNEMMRYAHFRQVTDLANEESIELLYDFLYDESNLIKSSALTEMNYITVSKYERENKYNLHFFDAKRNDTLFKKELAVNLKKLKTR
ncbi:MAG: hypothetical protein R2831_05060 [Chitinophagaceae bacterium]